MKFNTILSLIAMFSISVSYAQNSIKELSMKTADSLKMTYLSNAAMRYPLLRQGFVSAEVLGRGNIDAELNGNNLYKGKSQISRIRSVFNIPVVRFGKNTISSTLSYLQQSVNVTDVKSYNPYVTSTDFNYRKSTIGLTAVFTRVDSLFNRPVAYSASVSGLTDDLSRIRRFNYLGLVSVNLKRTPTTSYSVGGVVIIDPSSPSPFLPIFSYWHKFKSSDLELFVDIPSRIMLRKQFSERAWASFGTELSGNLAFFDFDKAILPRDFSHSSIELKTGPTVEYLIYKKIILGINGGLMTTNSSRFFRKEDRPDDYFMKNKNDAVPYINFSISFLPFLNAVR
ncbi:hypothetical protein [Pedobacter sp. FW305-3-2-15-E-R2A2]|uniref:hypothetical protein n=1 Tax=Pedobacter sp. FW305-3-2-15-E-R2A2 TaxID=3140251 RepID=UPI003140B353